MNLLYGVAGCIVVAVLMVVCFPLRQRRQFVLCSMLGVFVLTFGLYYKLGDAEGYQRSLDQVKLKAQVARFRQKHQTPEEVIAKLKSHLAEQPNSAKGWYLLGRLYQSNRQLIAAAEAFEQAAKLKPNNPDYVFQAMQSEYLRQHQTLSPRVKQYLHTLEQFPDYLATDLFIANHALRQGDNRTAIKHWRNVLRQLPASSSEHDQLLKMIAQAKTPSTI